MEKTDSGDQDLAFGAFGGSPTFDLDDETISQEEEEKEEEAEEEEDVKEEEETNEPAIRLEDKAEEYVNGFSEKQVACFNDNSRRTMDPSTIPVAVRLNVKRDTSIDLYRKQLPLPKSALPSTSLPAWNLMPLDKKIPNVLAPKGAVVLARGTLGQKLHVKKQEYTVYDPNHLERVVMDPYNSLHDPHARSYLNKPSVRKMLLKQGLITQEGKVLCSLTQFNKYRNYLKTVYNQGLDKCINQDYIRFKYDIQTVKNIAKFESDTAAQGRNFIKNERKQRAVKLHQLKREEFLKRYEAKQEAAQHRQKCHTQEKLRAKMNRCLLAEERKRLRRERVCRAMDSTNLKIQKLKMSVLAKDQAVQIRLENDKKYVVDSYQHFVREWLLAKWDFQIQRIDRDTAVRESLEKDLGERTLKRLTKVERYRQVMLLIQERRKAAEDRLWAIVRKYFRRWRDKVRSRKADLPDEKHQSLWDIKAAMESTNTFLHEKMGIGKFDDFILSILKLKSIIKTQLEKEEAEKASAMATAGAMDTSADKGNEDEDDSGENLGGQSDKLDDDEIILTGSRLAFSSPSREKKYPVSTTDLKPAKPKASAYAFKKRSRYLSKAGSRLEIKSSNRRITRVPSRQSRTSLKRDSGVVGAGSKTLRKSRSKHKPTLAQHNNVGRQFDDHAEKKNH